MVSSGARSVAWSRRSRPTKPRDALTRARTSNHTCGSSLIVSVFDSVVGRLFDYTFAGSAVIRIHKIIKST